MARIRSVKPNVFTSRKVGAWRRDVRLLWIGLWTYLDDYGRGDDEPALIRAAVFPMDDDVTNKKVDAWLTAIATSGVDPPLCRYEVAGQRYLHAVNWKEHQRVSHPGASRVPPCPHHESSGVAPESSGGPPELRGKPPEPLVNDPEPFRPSRAPAEQGARSKEQGKEQGSPLGSPSQSSPVTRKPQATDDDLDKIQAELQRHTHAAIDRAHTAKVRDQILDNAPDPPRRPTAYVAAAIRDDPGRYLPADVPEPVPIEHPDPDPERIVNGVRQARDALARPAARP